MSPTKEQIAELNADLEAMPPILVEIDGGMAFALIGIIQLACRHPGLKGSPTRKIAEQFARSLQDRMAQSSPEVGRLIEKGCHSCFDVPR